MRLFIVFIMPLSVNIYTFCHRHINGFVYSVLSQTPLRMVSDAQNRHCIAFLKSKKKSESPKTSTCSGSEKGFIDPELRSLPTAQTTCNGPLEKTPISPAHPDITSLVHDSQPPNPLSLKILAPLSEILSATQPLSGGGSSWDGSWLHFSFMKIFPLLWGPVLCKGSRDDLIKKKSPNE